MPMPDKNELRKNLTVENLMQRCSYPAQRYCYSTNTKERAEAIIANPDPFLANDYSDEAIANKGVMPFAFGLLSWFFTKLAQGRSRQKEALKLCDEWEKSNAAFQDAVKGSELVGITTNDLAEIFSVSPIVVDHWKKGMDYPFERDAQKIVSKIRKKINNQPVIA